VNPLLLPLEVPIRIGRDEARRRAAEELAKAKYGGTPEWLVELADLADRWVGRIVELILRIFLERGSGGGVSWGFLLAVGLVLVAIALVVWRVGLPRWRPHRRDAAVVLDSTRPAADYRALAAEDAARGDWAAAVRDQFRALVRELETQAILDVRPARTAWEAAYRASQALPTCRDALHAAAESFNAVVYGDRPANSTAYQQMVAVEEQVTAAAGQADLVADEPVNSR
jgi:Domain of unknown function (DUF4129)